MLKNKHSLVPQTYSLPKGSSFNKHHYLAEVNQVYLFEIINWGITLGRYIIGYTVSKIDSRAEGRNFRDVYSKLNLRK